MTDRPVLEAVGEVLAYPQDLVDRVGTAITHATHCNIRLNKLRTDGENWEIFDIETLEVLETHRTCVGAGTFCDLLNSDFRARAALEAIQLAGWTLSPTPIVNAGEER